MSHVITASTQTSKPNRKARCAGLRNAQRREMLKNGRRTTTAGMVANERKVKMEWINYFGLAMAFGAILGVVIHAASCAPLDEFGRRIDRDDE